jgi:hypothetical protein
MLVWMRTCGVDVFEFCAYAVTASSKAANGDSNGNKRKVIGGTRGIFRIDAIYGRLGLGSSLPPKA